MMQVLDAEPVLDWFGVGLIYIVIILFVIGCAVLEQKRSER